jgi:integrase
MAKFSQYELKDGSKLWKFQAYLGINQMTGKPVKTTRRNFRTKKEAQLALSRLQVDFEKDGLKQKSVETFQEIYDLWLETYSTTVKEVTLIKIKIKFDKWILPKYGNLRMNEITVKYAQKILNDWAKITDQYKVLHSTASRIFKYAINLGVLEYNPLDRILMPKRIKETTDTEKIKFYTQSQMNQLLSYVNSQSGTYRNDYDKTLLRFLFFSGCRISEVLCLNWDDISFKDNTVTISKTLSQTQNGYKVSTTKTEKSNGVVVLDDETIFMLKKWQLNQRRFMLSLGITDSTMIFCGIYKQYISHHAIYARMKTITTNAKVPFLGVHTTRHTHASQLLDSGATMVEVQHRLRHASIKISIDTYGHLSKETKEKTVEKLLKHLNSN